MGHTKDGSDAKPDAFTRHPFPPSLLPSDPHRQARRQGWLQAGGKGWRQWMCCTRLVDNPHPRISAHTRRTSRVKNPQVGWARNMEREDEGY